MDLVEDDLQLAHRAALAGAAVAMRYFAAFAGLRHELKVDGSVVTDADRAVEAAVRDVLAEARPRDTILGEEGGESAGRSADAMPGKRGGDTAGAGRRRWIIDPIDGTALFVSGDDRWLVLLALEEDSEITLGVAVVPARGRLWWARRGYGAWESRVDGGAPRRVSVAAHGPDRPRGSRLGVLPTFDDPQTGANVVPKAPEVVAPLLAVTPALPWALHPPLLVARGDLDLAVQTSGMVWDFAATALIVSEAGGVYRGLDGGLRPHAGPSLFARSDALAEAALRVLADGGARPSSTASWTVE